MRYVRILGCLALISVAINVFQAVRISALKDQLEAKDVVNTSIIGSEAAEIKALNMAGQPVAVRLDQAGKPTIIYVFRPSCVWCSRNSDALRSLIKQTAQRYNVIGLSLDADGLTSYVKEHDITIPVYSNPDPAALARYQLGTTPETMVVSPRGIIIQDWRGAYSGGVGDAVEHFFNARLPKLNEGS